MELRCSAPVPSASGVDACSRKATGPEPVDDERVGNCWVGTVAASLARLREPLSRERGLDSSVRGAVGLWLRVCGAELAAIVTDSWDAHVDPDAREEGRETELPPLTEDPSSEVWLPEVRLSEVRSLEGRSLVTTLRPDCAGAIAQGLPSFSFAGSLVGAAARLLDGSTSRSSGDRLEDAGSELPATRRHTGTLSAPNTIFCTVLGLASPSIGASIIVASGAITSSLDSLSGARSVDPKLSGTTTRRLSLRAVDGDLTVAAVFIMDGLASHSDWPTDCSRGGATDCCCGGATDC